MFTLDCYPKIGSLGPSASQIFEASARINAGRANTDMRAQTGPVEVHVAVCFVERTVV